MEEIIELLNRPAVITARIGNRNEKIETLRSVAMKTTTSPPHPVGLMQLMQ